MPPCAAISNNDMERENLASLLDRLDCFAGRLALIGTCKNAGKTSILNVLLSRKGGQGDAVTSLGRDGEPFDLVERIPKPAVVADRGALFATAAQSSERCRGRWQLEARTKTATPLGEILIGRCLERCELEVAGPSRVDATRDVLEIMRSLGARRLFVDGAFDRLAGAAARLGDAVLLAAGSAGAASVEDAARRTAAFVRRFQLPAVSPTENQTQSIRLQSLTSAQFNDLEHRTVILPDPSCCLIETGDWPHLQARRVRVLVEHASCLLGVFTSSFRPHLASHPAPVLLQRVRELCPGVAVFDLRLEGIL